ncbi:MAG: sialate O-acetylesterase, partial [Phycisphaeraceae bacterium]
APMYLTLTVSKPLIRAVSFFGFAITLALFANPAQAEHYKVFLLGGQSNMDGRAATSGLTGPYANLQNPQADVQFYEGGSLRVLQPGSGTDFGPEITFGRTIADEFGDDNFALIKYAVGASDLANDWDPNTGSQYSSFQSTVTNGITALTTGANAGNTYEIVGMLWTQGERDARTGRTATQYQADLKGFIAGVRDDYGSDLPFFYSRLSSGQTDLSAGQLSAIRTAQDNVAAGDANAYLSDTDGMSIKSDNLHFDAAGQIALGEAFALSYISSVPEPSSLCLLAIAAAGVLIRRR